MKKKYIIERSAIETPANIPSDGDPMQKIEEALQYCGFGRFHVRLTLASMTAVFAISVCACSSTFIAPSAECDLDLSNVQKGFLIGASSLGQFTSSPIGGYFSDAFGRRLFLIYGNILMSFCCLLQGFSNTYWVMIIFKLGEGVFTGLAWVQIAPMLAEMSSKDIRDRLLLFNTQFFSIGQSVVTLFAWAVLPTGIHVIVWDGYFGFRVIQDAAGVTFSQFLYLLNGMTYNYDFFYQELKAWKLFLFVCAIWGLLAAFQYSLLPESPKYLLSSGKAEEALEIIRQIYSENTRKKKDHFPMASLACTASPNNRKNGINQVIPGLFNVKELLRKPLVYRLILMSFSCFVCTLTLATLRLWYPQLSTLIEDYKKLHDGEPSKLCTMLDSYYYQNKSQVIETLSDKTEICVPKISGVETYTNTLIMGLSGGVLIGISVSLVNRVGMKLMVVIGLIAGSACSLALHWVNTSVSITTAIIVVYAFNNASYHLINGISVRAFPTTVRSLALALTMTSGRFGALLGTSVFPIVMEYGCIVPFGFLTVALFLLGLVCIFLPNPTKENKETGDR